MNRMKRTIWGVVFIAMIFVSCGEDEDNQWTNDPYISGFGMLIFDYSTQEFEGGYFKEYPSCENCGGDSIPLEILYRSPGDFGYVGFQYPETGDTLFFGTIIWMGRGHISQPVDMLPASDFELSGSLDNEPLSIQYYHDGYHTQAVSYESIVDPIWSKASQIDLVTDISRGEYRIAYYLYPPTVGLFDPEVAKWLLILYAE